METMNAKNGMSGSCPVCGGMLNEKAAEGVLIPQCMNCGGAWVRDEELRLILETTDTDRRYTDEVRAGVFARPAFEFGWEDSISCPDCGLPMKSFQFLLTSRIYLDFCPEHHGIWLEQGRLERLLPVWSEYQKRFSLEPGPPPARSLPGEVLPPIHLEY